MKKEKKKKVGGCEGLTERIGPDPAGNKSGAASSRGQQKTDLCEAERLFSKRCLVLRRSLAIRVSSATVYIKQHSSFTVSKHQSGALPSTSAMPFKDALFNNRARSMMSRNSQVLGTAF